MLLTKSTIGVNDVATFKLVSGDEIAGKVIDITDAAYVVDKPVLCQITSQGVMQFPALLAADLKKVDLNKSNILYSAVVSQEFERVYIEATSSIATVPAGTIIK